MISLDFIFPEQTYSLRNLVLRPGQSRDACIFVSDKDPLGFHLGAFIKSSGEQSEPVCVASFHPEVFPSVQSDHLIAAKHPYRLRGMATHPDFTRKKIGTALLEMGIGHLRALGSDLLWFNARQKAFGFYQSMGFDFGSELFEIEGVGLHKVMLKYL